MNFTRHHCPPAHPPPPAASRAIDAADTIAAVFRRQRFAMPMMLRRQCHYFDCHARR